MSDITPTSTKITVAELAVDLKYIKDKLDQIYGHTERQDERIDKLERVAWVISGVGTLMAAILVPVAVAGIKKWLGL